MDEKELLKERFKIAISSAVKVISEQLDLDIKFGKNYDSKKNSLNLPEILKLKREHIDFDKRLCTFYDTKNGEDRTIPLTDTAIEILKRHRFGDTLFSLLARRLRKHFTIACKRAQIINFRFHDLRACFCTNAFLSGLSVAEVSSLSGHKSWSELKRYSRIKPEDLLDKVNNIVSIK